MEAAGPSEVVFIAAVARHRVIGSQNRLPWRIPEDLRRFKQTTLGHPVVMGRKTFESLGKPLPGRTNIVVTHRSPAGFPEGVRTAAGITEGLGVAATLDSQVFVIGGGQIFAEVLPQATKILATLVHAEVPGDAFFPGLGPAWHVVAREDVASPQPGGGPALRISFVDLVRGPKADGCALCLLRRVPILGDAGGGVGARGTVETDPWEDGFRAVLGDLVDPPRGAPAEPRGHPSP